MWFFSSFTVFTYKNKLINFHKEYINNTKNHVWVVLYLVPLKCNSLYSATVRMGCNYYSYLLLFFALNSNVQNQNFPSKLLLGDMKLIPQENKIWIKWFIKVLLKLIIGIFLPKLALQKAFFRVGGEYTNIKIHFAIIVSYKHRPQYHELYLHTFNQDTEWNSLIVLQIPY